jgi:hypothetical protein
VPALVALVIAEPYRGKAARFLDPEKDRSAAASGPPV